SSIAPMNNNGSNGNCAGSNRNGSFVQTDHAIKRSKALGVRRYDVPEVAEALRQAEGRVHTAAAYLGCSHTTLHSYLRENPELQEIREHMFQLRGDIIETNLDEAARRGEAWAVCLILKSQYKNRGYVERTEMTGPNGGPVVTTDLT